MEKRFVQLTKQWYAKENLRATKYGEEILIAVDYPNLHDVGEFALRWYPIENGKLPALRIEIFEDSFQAFLDSGLTFHLGFLNKTNPQPDDIRKILLSMGFEETIAERSLVKTHPDLPAILKLMRAMEEEDLLNRNLRVALEKTYDIDIFKIALDEKIKWRENK